VGTILHRTHLPLQKWLLALLLALSANAGLSSRRLAHELEVSKDTALRISTKIRAAMADRTQRELLFRLVEVDTAVEGRRRGRHRDALPIHADAGAVA
jgi:orotate phosphoribosyltransferase-like protein